MGLLVSVSISKSVINPAVGDTLTFNGEDWIFNSGAASINIGDLADVDITNIADGTVLKYNSTTEKWECAADDTGGGSAGYTERGNINVHDFTKEALTLGTGESNFQNLNVSSIVPSGTHLVQLFVVVKHVSVGQSIIFRKPGYTGVQAFPVIRTHVANETFYENVWVPAVNGIIQYTSDVSNWTRLDISVCGWF